MNNGFLEYKVNSLVENSKLSPQEKKSIKNNLFYQTPVSTKKMDGDLLFYSQQYNQMLEMNRQQAILINAQLSVQNGLTQVQKTQPETSAPPADAKPSAPPAEAKPAQETSAPEPSAPPSEEKPAQEKPAPEPSAPPSEEKPAPEPSAPPSDKEINAYGPGFSETPVNRQKFKEGDKIVNVTNGLTGKIKSLRDDTFEQNARRTDPTHYFYHVTYDNGTFDTYVSQNDLKSASPTIEPKLKQDNKYLVGGSDDKMYEQKYLKYKAKYYNLLSKM